MNASQRPSGLTFEFVASQGWRSKKCVILTRLPDPSSFNFQRSRVFIVKRPPVGMSTDDSRQQCCPSGKIPSHSLWTRGSSI